MRHSGTYSTLKATRFATLTNQKMYKLYHGTSIKIIQIQSNVHLAHDK
jgi:hypothetical protein